MYDKNLKTRMAAMPPKQLKDFAALHKDDPFIMSMALSIDNDRKAAQRQMAMQALNQQQPQVVDQRIAAIGQPEMPPQEVLQSPPSQAMPLQAAPQAQAGLPQIPAQNIASMADGGIAGYAEGDEVKGGRDSYRAYAMQKAQEMGLDPAFVDGIFRTESDYNPKAKSKTGPQGIGQLTSYIAKKFGITPKERLDPYKNMDASIGFIDYLNKKYKGDKAKVAVAYNQGEGVLNEHLKQNNGQLVPEKLHENVKTANKEEPLNYLKKMTAAGAITPPAAQMAETGTREAPRTPEMLARQKEALRRRQVAEALPIGAAQAGETAPVATPAPSKEGIQALQNSRFSDASVPGTPAAAAADAARAAKLAKAEKETSVMDKIYGGAEALHGLALGYPAMATGLINLPSVQNFLAPKTEKGKEYSANLHKLLVEEGKLPPYIPSLGVSKPSALTPEAAARAAEAAKRAETAAVNAETAAAPRLPAPSKGGAKPDILAGYRTDPVTGEVTPRWATEQTRTFDVAPESAEFGAMAVRDRLLREQGRDVAKAKEEAALLQKAAEVAGDETNAARLVDEQNAGIQRLQTGAPKPLTALGGAATTLPVVPDKQTTPHVAYSEEPGYDYTKPEAAETPAGEVPIEERSTMATPEKKTGLGALSDDDWMMMGLSMLQAPAGQSGNALSQLAQNIGRSGLATLGAKKEREKTEFEKLQKQALTDYYAGMTKQLGQAPSDIRSLQALMDNPKLMEQYEKMERAKDATRANAALVSEYYKATMMNPDLSWNDFVQKYQSLSGTGGTGQFRVVGSRPS